MPSTKITGTLTILVKIGSVLLCNRMLCLVVLEKGRS
jgi:hypothetical protein